MTQVLIGVRGLRAGADTERVLEALCALRGVGSAQSPEEGQLEVRYQPELLSAMDLIRSLREQGYLAGML